MENATDIIYARKVAEYIGSEHTEYILDEKELIDFIEEDIRTIETYDTTTVRALHQCYICVKK